MPALYHRDRIAKLSAPEGFVDIRLKEERVSESEGRRKAHRRIGGEIGFVRRPRTFFSRIRKVRFVDDVRTQSAIEVKVKDIDLRRALGTVRRSAVSRNVKCL